MVFDPRTWSDEEMEKVGMALYRTGGMALPRSDERQAFLDEQRRRQEELHRVRAGRPRSPASNVDDNLEASASPIAVEQTAGMPTGWGPRGRDMRQEQIDRLIAAGDDPVTAARVVDHEMATNSGRIQPGLFDSYNTPQGNEALRGRIADGRRANARQDAFEANYNAATGHPEYGYDEAGNPARVGVVDIDNPSEMELRARGERAYNARDPRGAEAMAAGGEIGSDYAPYTPEPQYADMTVPGPRTLDGKSPTQSRGLTAEEAEAYNTRKPGQLSQRDRDMMARGYVPVVTADGVSYRPGYVSESNKYAIPGGPGRPGPRRDLEQTFDNTKKPKYEMDVVTGPDGVPRSVYVPTQEFRDQQAGVMQDRRQRLAAERSAKRKEWQAVARLAGGSQNLNSGNRWIANALVDMSPEDRASSMRYMLPGGDRAAAVDAQNMQNAGDVIKRYLTAGAAGGGFGSPASEAAMKQRQRDDAKTWFDKWHGNREPGWDGNYTSAQHDSAVNFMMQQYGISRPEAEAIAQSHGTPTVSTPPPRGLTAPSAGGADGGFTGG